ncbi:MAG: pantoate--beta-alanine ligase [Chitinophagaceae bacterium]|nr:pantoate--beta-alanine ligase [Chitinophagaceae bacterium]
MLIFHQAHQLQNYLSVERNRGKRIGFAPTMGALHQGHLSLIEESKKQCDVTVCSIFVNPTQFNSASDFEKYPVTIKNDMQLLLEAGCTVLFLPSTIEIYPSGTNNLAVYDLGFLETVLEGPTRPGHFQGVCQVMDQLLSIVMPHHLFMGRKDYQQCMVVKRLIELKGWVQNIQFHACPTLREPDGLATSSRNMRLNEEERRSAVWISKTLLMMKEELQPGSLVQLKQKAFSELQRHGFKTDYAEIANADTLELVNEWNGAAPLVGLIAAFCGDVRLIDNMTLR